MQLKSCYVGIFYSTCISVIANDIVRRSHDVELRYWSDRVTTSCFYCAVKATNVLYLVQKSKQNCVIMGL